MTIKASMVTIQEATPEDITYINSLDVERIKERSSHKDAQTSTYTVELEGKFIGYMSVTEDRQGTIEIEEFALLEDYRGKGFGRLAVRALFTKACANTKMSGFYMRCLATEEPMIRLSTTEGFSIVGSDDKFFHLCKPCNEGSSECIDHHKNMLSENDATLYRDNQEGLKGLIKALQNS